jgi:hypothetical protein
MLPTSSSSWQLCNYAQEWADRLARENRIYHRTGLSYGENIYVCSNSPHCENKDSASDAVDQWYSEARMHTYGSDFFNMSTGHFTQVVWKTTTKLGMAKAEGNGWVYIVANYSPQGNMQGAFRQNVKPPTH